LKEMGENSITLKDAGPGHEGIAARNWASFFYVVALAVGLSGSLFVVSCETTASGPEKEIVSEVPVVSTESRVEHIEPKPASNPEHIQPEPDTVDKQDCDPAVEADLRRLRAENAFLMEENSRLQLEMIRLNEELTEANLEIYSLNRKLDAIFKPEPETERF
jgi:hypothetical protein